MMKDYLNTQELNDFMLIGALLDSAAKIRTGWSSRNNISKEEHRAIKTAETYLQKFYVNTLLRLSDKEKKKVHNRLKDFELKIIDKYTLKRMSGTWQDEMKIAHVDRDEFQDWCTEIMKIKCCHCNKSHGECSLYDVFHNNFIPESSWGLNNCRYAYKK